MELNAAYRIKGRVTDQTDNSPLIGANIKLMTDSNNIMLQSQIDNNGDFAFINIEISNLTIEINCIGYKTWRTIISGNNSDIDLGIIKIYPTEKELAELTVLGTSVIQKADRYVILPSKDELNRASESIDLLSELKIKMPGLKVNEVLQSVTIDGGTPVFMINGKVQPLTKIMGLNHQNIQRIEYHNTADIRFLDGGTSGIINFIMTPTQEGGSVMARLTGAVTTLKNNAQINASYNNKKSEWNFSYNNIWRESKKQYSNIYEEFIGQEKPIIREQIGKPSGLNDFYNNLALDYTYMHNPNTMFVATVGLIYQDNRGNDENRIIEKYGNVTTEYTKYYHRSTKKTTPTLDTYFKKTFQKDQILELNTVGTTSYGEYGRGIDNTNNYQQQNNTTNSSWTISGEALYTRSFKNLSTKFGINYSHSYAENKYAENGSSCITDKLSKDNLYFYGNIAGTIKQFGYNIGVGGKYFQSQDINQSRTYLRPKSTISLNYGINKKLSLSYLFMYSPSLPSLSSFSDIVQTIDDISLQVGNVNVKPSVWMRNRVLLSFNSGNFYSSLQGSYNYTKDPIVSTYQYINDRNSPYYNKFLRRVENGDFERRINTEITLGYQDLFKYFTVQATVGWDKYDVSGKGYKGKDSHIYASASINAYWDKWSVSLDFEIAPQYTIEGTNKYRSIQNNYVSIGYNLKTWNFECSLSNPFTKKAFYQTSEDISDVNPSKTESYIQDFSNLVEIRVQYRINFGKNLTKVKRSLQNRGIDNGVNVNY